MSATRTETDSMGSIEVPAEHYWGAQTQRSIEHFPIGRDTFVWGRTMIRALGLLKLAAVEANAELGTLSLDADQVEAVRRAAREVVDGERDGDFPLVVFQTGSGTQSNMNANEVIANRAIEVLGGTMGSKTPIHPNDHVNRGQSSNDTFPTAMHVAIRLELHERLYGPVEALRDTLGPRPRSMPGWSGGAHPPQDATPITLGQEISACGAVGCRPGWGLARRGESGRIGDRGTAVGTGLNTHRDFGSLVAQHLS